MVCVAERLETNTNIMSVNHKVVVHTNTCLKM